MKFGQTRSILFFNAPEGKTKNILIPKHFNDITNSLDIRFVLEAKQCDLNCSRSHTKPATWAIECSTNANFVAGLNSNREISEEALLTGAVDAIPLSVGPEACGLDANALFAYRDGLADRLWRDAATLYPDVDGGRDGNDDGRNETVRNAGADILRSLPGPFDVGKVKTFYGDKCRSPGVVVLLRELDKFNALLEAVRGSLSQLAKVTRTIVRGVFAANNTSGTLKSPSVKTEF